MKLNPPTTIVFLIAVIIAIVALLAGFSILPALPISSFWLMTVAFVLLAVSVLIPGL
jgi:hypothetical protein